jgi:hypothetical protein
VDTRDTNEVHTAMLSWWDKQKRLGLITSFHTLSRRPKKKKLFASGLKDTLELHRKKVEKKRCEEKRKREEKELRQREEGATSSASG